MAQRQRFGFQTQRLGVQIPLGSNRPFFFGISVSFWQVDTVAEWLRRQPAKLMGFPRVGSSPIGVDTFFFWSKILRFGNKKEKNQVPKVGIEPTTFRSSV